MENTRLKFKVGVHEFEAEGPMEIVQEQLKAFRELIAAMPAAAAPSPAPSSASASPSPSPDPSDATETSNGNASATFNGSRIDEGLSTIMKTEHRVVSLTVRASSLDDAVLLLVYGQKVLRGNDAVTGAEIMSGLTATGQRVSRVDRLLAKAGEAGDIIVIGMGRAKRYRLTNIGLDKARRQAGKLIETVA